MKNNLNNINNIVYFFFSALRVAIASPHQSDHQTAEHIVIIYISSLTFFI